MAVRTSTFAAIAHLLITSGCLAFGILLSVLACAFWVWWPMFVLLLFVCGGCPNFVFGFSYSEAKEDEVILGVNSCSRFTYVGNFLGAFFVTSAIGLALVLWHAEVIKWPGFVMGVIGGLVVYSSLMSYIYTGFWLLGRGKNADDEDDIF